MTEDERSVVMQALCKLALATVGHAPDSTRLLVYLEQLDSDSCTEVLDAIRRLTRGSKFFPAVGEIVAEMEAVRQSEGEEAWREALRLSRSTGDEVRAAYAKDPRLKAACQDAGGIAAIRNRLTRDEPFIRRNFLKVYSRGADPRRNREIDWENGQEFLQ